MSCENLVKVIGECGGVHTSGDAKLSLDINCKDGGSDNCPRSCDSWSKECVEHSRYTGSQLTAIAEQVDDQSAFFGWASGTDLARFSSTVNPSLLTQKSQARRQFAVLLANISVGQLHIATSTGAWVKVDPATSVQASGFAARTVGGLVREIDGVLASLEGQNASDATVKARYDQVSAACSAINRGVGIALSDGCHDGDGDDARAPSGSSVGGQAGSLTLYRAAPNPFTRATQFAYEVTGTDASVEIAVFDVAGRQVRRLVSTTQPAGRYTVTWDGKSDDGASVTRGVYFVRTVIAGSKAPVQRLLFIRDGK